jgi:hypothetical protein
MNGLASAYSNDLKRLFAIWRSIQCLLSFPHKTFTPGCQKRRVEIATVILPVRRVRRPGMRTRQAPRT